MSLSSTIKKFLSSPKGQQLMDRGKHELSKPENQEKVRRLIGKNRGR